MKKNLLAASVAALVAAPAASFADVTISGNVIQEFVTDSDDTGSSEDGLESASAVDLVFSVSEDLGNGMSAFAKIHTLRDNGGSGNANQVVGLKGDFGTLTVGRMENFSESKLAGPTWVESTDAIGIEPNGAYDTKRAEGGIAYVSPSFNGLTFGVQGYALPNMGSSATVTTITAVSGLSSNTASAQTIGISGSTATLTNQDSSAKDADANIDATDIMIEYANAGLTLRAAYETVDGSVYGDSTKKDQKTTSALAMYKMGDVEVRAYAFDVDNGNGVETNDTDGYSLGAIYTMGANRFTVNYSEEDDVSSAGTKESGQDEAWAVSFSHALSKRTSINAAFVATEDGSDSTDKDKYAVGISHVF